MADSRPNFMKNWLPAILWAVAILVISTIRTPEIETPELFIGWDKLAHFFLYACFTFLVIRPLRYGPHPMPLVPVVFLSFVGASGYGIIIEVYQTLVEREMEVADALANAVGSAVVASVYLVVSLNRNRVRRKAREQRECQRED